MSTTKKYVLVPAEELEKLMKILLNPNIEGFIKTVAAANFNLEHVKYKGNK